MKKLDETAFTERELKKYKNMQRNIRRKRLYYLVQGQEERIVKRVI